MRERCFWCNVDPDDAEKRHEAPHLKWCLRYRESPLPAGVRRAHGSFVMDFPKFEGDPAQLPKADVMEVELCLGWLCRLQVRWTYNSRISELYA